MGAVGLLYRQGYLSNDQACAVRVRLAGNRGYLTINGTAAEISHPEYEYPLQLNDDSELLDQFCLKPLIE